VTKRNRIPCRSSFERQGESKGSLLEEGEERREQTYDKLADLFGKHDDNDGTTGSSPKPASFLETLEALPTTLDPSEISVGAKEDEEKRYDTDGVPYSKAEFIEYYGGTREWNMAQVAKRVDQAVNDQQSPLIVSSSEDPSGKEEGDLSAFRLSPSTIQKLNDRGVEKLFPIQKMTFDQIFDGEDVLARARTGTGKTLAFSLPVVEKLGKSLEGRGARRSPRVLVLTPTRELARQVATDFQSIGHRVKTTTLYGGAPFGPQAGELRRGTDVVVGTAGRVMDHMNAGSFDLSEIDVVIMDEADRMLDIGFADDIETILQEITNQRADPSSKPQMLLFSATVPKWIKQVARKYMDPSYSFVDLIGDDNQQTAKGITHLALKVDKREMASTLGDVVQVHAGRHGRTIIFTQTKAEANELVLGNTIKQECLALHGDIPQEQRERTLAAFRDGNFRCLIATDVAARGLDIPAVDVVIQVQPPKNHEDFIHRSGRTARAGKEGTSIMMFPPRDERLVRQIEQKAGVSFKRIGAPQPKDIIEACADDACHSISLVPDDAVNLFSGRAEKLINELGAERALAAALAQISGHTEMKQRSLLSSQSGFTTWAIKLDRPAAGKAVIRRLLSSGLDPTVMGAIRGLVMFTDNMGAAFDVPVEFNDHIEEWSGLRGEMERLETLPDLQLENDRSYNNRGGSNNRGGFNNRGGDRNGDRNGRRRPRSFERDFQQSGPVFPGGPEMGATYDGVVTGVLNFGAFVDYGYGKDGLVATRNLADMWIDNPEEVVRRGDKVKVRVTGCEDGKVRLSMKGLNPHLRN